MKNKFEQEVQLIPSVGFLHNTEHLIKIPINKGINIITSKFFPKFLFKTELLLFKLNMLSDNKAMIRTYDGFTVTIRVRQDEISEQVIVNSNGLKTLNSLQNLEISIICKHFDFGTFRYILKQIDLDKFNKDEINLFPELIDLTNSENEENINNMKNSITVEYFNLNNINVNFTPNNNKNIPKDIKTNLGISCTICFEKIYAYSCLVKCNHIFCKECIDQWVKLSSACPLCKLNFKEIIYRDSNNNIIKKRQIKKRKYKFQEENDDTWVENCLEYCMKCKKVNDVYLMLVCDKCKYNVCHTYCAGLDMIPDEEWSCFECNPEYKNFKKS